MEEKHDGVRALKRGAEVITYIFLNINVRNSTQISLKFVLKGPIDNKSALFRVVSWRLTGDKPLPEPILTQFTDAYVRL